MKVSQITSRVAQERKRRLLIPCSSALVLFAVTLASTPAEGPNQRPHSPIAYYRNRVSVKVVLKFRMVESNGWPDYWQHVTMGPVWTASNQAITGFPNADCPTAPKPQDYKFQMEAYPNVPTKFAIGQDIGLKLFGVAVNGVPFDPAANAYWDTAAGTHVTQNPNLATANKDWTFEILTGKLQLGPDKNNAHVQGTGAYHYHGMPTGLLEELTRFLDAIHGQGPAPLFKNMILLGYAADGYPVYSCYVYTRSQSPPGQRGSIGGYRTHELKSSYVLKNNGGARAAGEPSGWFMQGVPGKTFQSTNYDGTFTQDFVYQKGYGDLDECNGTSGVTPEYPDGTYYYVITSDFPFIPRKLKGTPNPTFNIHDQ